MEPSHRPRHTWALVALLVAVGTSGCAATTGADATPGGASGLTTSGLTSPSQLPDPCSLLGAGDVAPLLGASVNGVGAVGPERADDPLLFRTCTWGDVDTPSGAIGVQIGAPNGIGHDVVFNRSSAMDPAVDYPGMPGGKQTMNVGVMPTGGARGATVFFQVGGFSVLVAQVGSGVVSGDVEDLGFVVYRALGGA